MGPQNQNSAVPHVRFRKLFRLKKLATLTAIIVVPFILYSFLNDSRLATMYHINSPILRPAHESPCATNPHDSKNYACACVQIVTQPSSYTFPIQTYYPVDNCNVEYAVSPALTVVNYAILMLFTWLLLKAADALAKLVLARIPRNAV
jgi:hypothetical protein